MRSAIVRFLACCSLALLVSCGGSGDDKGGDARIRLLNLSTGYTSLDLSRMSMPTRTMRT